MNKQTSVSSILHKTAENWSESNNAISPEILRIHRIRDYLHNDLNQVLVAFDLQAAEFSVLETLRKEAYPHCLTPTSLSSTMLFSSGGLTKVLNRLANAGFITRTDNFEDKRGKLVQLSKSGNDLITKVIVELHSQEQEKMAVLSITEKQLLNQLLHKVLGVWE
jgi:DNA-binding MarR family transcriptional regulator